MLQTPNVTHTPKLWSNKSTVEQMTLASSFAKAVPYDRNSTNWREITDAVMIYEDLAKDMAPVRLVEKPGFKNLKTRCKIWLTRLQFLCRKSTARVVHPSKRKHSRTANKRDVLLNNHRPVGPHYTCEPLHWPVGVKRQFFPWRPHSRAHCPRTVRCSHIAECIRKPSGVHRYTQRE